MQAINRLGGFALFFRGARPTLILAPGQQGVEKEVPKITNLGPADPPRRLFSSSANLRRTARCRADKGDDPIVALSSKTGPEALRGACAEIRRCEALCLVNPALRIRGYAVTIQALTPSDPRLAPYLDLQGRGRGPEILVEGEFAVQRLLASALEVQSVVATPAVAARLHALSPDTPIYSMSAAQLREVAGFAFHRGCIGCALRPTLKASTPTHAGLIAMGLSDPLNLGALIRNARAFGASGVWLGPSCADPYSRKSTRASMGHNLTVPLASLPAPELTLETLRKQGIATIAAALGPKAKPLPSLPVPEQWTLWVGNEGHGLPAELTDQCSHWVEIPMAPHSDSVNVATATGIFLYALTQSGATTSRRSAE